MNLGAAVERKPSSIVNVVAGDYCIGCGACAVGPHAGASIEYRDGRYRVELKSPDHPTLGAVCPFADEAPSEDELAAQRFSGFGTQRAPEVGHYLRLGAAWVASDAARLRSSSGGLLTWVAERLLMRGDVDAVIHVQPSQDGAGGSPLFRYAVSRTVDEVRAGSSSRYYPVSMHDVLSLCLADERRYALVGVPCFIKAVNLLMRQDPQLQRRIPFLLGLVCGHLKTAGFAEVFAAQMGVEPRSIASINFRKKLPDHPANRYGVEIADRSAVGQGAQIRQTATLYGSDWGHSLFKLKACDFCDDIFAETADFAVGDAWLPEFVSEWRGTSVLVSRNPIIEQVLQQGIDAGELAFTPLSVAKMAQSQRSNFVQRRETLPFRLAQIDLTGQWRPRKRFEPRPPNQVSIDPIRGRIVELRSMLGPLSHEVWQEARRIQEPAKAFHMFRTTVEPLTDELAYLSTVGHSSTDGPHSGARGQFIRILINAALTYSRSVRALPLGGRARDSALVLPPASPGSLGDEAVLRSLLAELRARGVRRFTFLSYEPGDDWSHLGRGIRSLCIADFLGYRSKRNEMALLAATATSSRLIVCGTDVLDGHHSTSRSVARFAVMEAVAAAGLPVIVVGASFSEEAAPAARHALRRAGPAVHLCARDPISAQVMQDVLGRPVTLVADPAFFLRPERASSVTAQLMPWVEAQRAAGRTLLGLNVNHFLARAARDTEGREVVEAFSALANDLLQRRPDLAICLLPHDVRGSPSDVDLARAVRAAIRSELADRCAITPDGLAAGEIKDVVTCLDVVFTGKMHLSIAALGSATPVGCITYKDKKFLGLFAHFGLEDWLLPEASWRKPEQMLSFVERLLDQRVELKRRIAERLPIVRDLSSRNFDACIA